MAPSGRRSGRKRTQVNGEHAGKKVSNKSLGQRKGKSTKDEQVAGRGDNNDTEKEKVTSEYFTNGTKENRKPSFTSDNLPEAFCCNNRLQPNIRGFNPCGLHSSNIFYRLQHNTLGITPERTLRQAVVQTYTEDELANFRILTTASPFDRRVTAMQWHPTLPNTVAVGSKGGDLILWNFTKPDGKYTFMEGIGAGGSITHLQFDTTDPSFIYTSSIDGMVSRQDFHGNQKTVLLNTGNWSYWYCSLDVNYKSNVLVAGDNLGNTVMMTRQGEKAWSHRLHKSKVTHCEFNKQCEWLLVTASTDKVVKLWDIRKVGGRKNALYELPHDRPINSAYFSPDCSRLLTTDQHNEIRVYGGPLWDRMVHSIAHPHRQFQHLTPIKATWHPIHDLIVVGRYPDPAFPGYQHGENRTIDIFDANSGDMVCQLLDGSAKGIISVCQFNKDGRYLATGMGVNILLWTDVAKLTQTDASTLTISSKAGAGLNPNRSSNTAPRRRNRRRNNDDDDDGDEIDKVKKKLKKTNTKAKTTSKTKTETKSRNSKSSKR